MALHDANLMSVRRSSGFRIYSGRQGLCMMYGWVNILDLFAKDRSSGVQVELRSKHHQAGFMQNTSRP